METKVFGAIPVFLMLLLATNATAQVVTDGQQELLQLQRPELEQLEQELNETARSSAYSGALRAQASTEAELVRQRLSQGDFQVGDQITLVVEGEEQLSGTFAVRAGKIITLPVIGDIPLAGVLRSELQPHLRDHLARFIREPVVHARSLFRIGILGAVGRPGYHLMPGEMLLVDAIMQAGGPSSSARLDAVSIVRSGETIWQGPELQQAITEGRTLDRMSLRAGDQIVVPDVTQTRSAVQIFQRALVVIPTIIMALTGLAQIM